ncbi:MAG TPA: hypothetical protein DEF12_01820, partial [Rhodobacteraceae bacterium]|nr:hypothetical protein [Paracoccaceae bacterium]
KAAADVAAAESAAPAADAVEESAPEAAPQADAAQPAELSPQDQALAPAEPAEVEVFYTFTWGRKPQGDRAARGPRRGGPARDASAPEGAPREKT